MTWPSGDVTTTAMDSGSDTPPRAEILSWAQKFNQLINHFSTYMRGLMEATDAAAARTTLDVPSRSGGNASGTWGINISGNAATATNVSGVVAVANGGTGQNDLGTFQSTLRINTARVNVASASTVNLTTGAASTDHINITGTTTISGFTVAAGRMLFVRFGDSLILTNGASLGTPNGADMVTQNGDTCILQAVSANVVNILCYRSSRWARQDGTAPFFACRGFLYYNGATNTILSSGNCSSVTDNGGNGDYTYNFTTAMPSAAYAVATGGRITSPGYSSVQEDGATAKTSSAFRFSSVAQSGGAPTAVDCTGISLIIFG